MHARSIQPFAAFARRIRAIAGDRRGVAAVEFALIVPVMLAMYLGTMEMSVAVSVNKKVSRVASTVADLVTQQSDTSTTNLDAMMEIGGAVLFPYQSSKPDITITAINVDSSYPQGGKVAWSRRYDKGTFKTGPSKTSDIAVPANLISDGTFLIKVETSLDYIPAVSWLIGDSVGTTKNGVGLLQMSEHYFLRPRLGSTITCSTC